MIERTKTVNQWKAIAEYFGWYDYGRELGRNITRAIAGRDGAESLTLKMTDEKASNVDWAVHELADQQADGWSLGF